MPIPTKSFPSEPSDIVISLPLVKKTPFSTEPLNGGFADVR